MPRLFIPNELRHLTDGAAEVDLPAESLREAIEALEACYPGVAERLVDQGRIAAGVAVSVDGQISSRGLLTRLQPDSEVHFLPAIGGGWRLAKPPGGEDSCFRRSIR